MLAITSRLICLKSVHNNAHRFFALQASSHYIPGKILATQVFDHIKHQNDLPNIIDINMCNISNIYDDNSGIKKLMSVIVHSLEPSPSYVTKLFSLYHKSNVASIFRYNHSIEMNKKLQFRIQSSVPYMSLEELHQISVSLTKFLPLDLRFFRDLSELTMEECVTRADSADSLSTAIKFFLIAMEMHGNRICNKKCYSAFISVFEKFVKKATKVQLAHLLYFVGLAKSRGILYDLPHTATNLIMPNFDELSFIDAGIAVIGAFRVGLKFDANHQLNNKIAAKLSERIHTDNNAVTSLTSLESFSFISLVKYLRFGLYREYELLKSMKHFLIKLEAESWNAQFACHTLALYANCNFYDYEVYSLLADKFFKYLKSSNELVRIKDISRTMWALSHSQHPCTDKDLDTVVKHLVELCECGELQAHPTHIVDSTLALAVFNVFPEDLYKAVLQYDVHKNIKGKKLNRCLSRLLVLSEVQKVVFPTLPCPSFEFLDENFAPVRTINEECFHRPCVKRVADAIQWLNKKCGKRVFEIKFVVPHIHFCSFVVNDKPIGKSSSTTIKEKIRSVLSSLENQKVLIDLNDATTSLVNEDRAIGMEQLKRNLLRRMGWNVTVLSEKQVVSCGDDIESLAALIMGVISNSEGTVTWRNEGTGVATPIT